MPEHLRGEMVMKARDGSVLGNFALSTPTRSAIFGLWSVLLGILEFSGNRGSVVFIVLGCLYLVMSGMQWASARAEARQGRASRGKE
jgi:hypothetical protein